MKILQIVQFFHPVIGGLEQYVYRISEQFVKNGHEVHVLTVDQKEGRSLGPTTEKYKGIIIHRVPIWLDLGYRMKFWPSGLYLLSRYSFDLVHIYSHGHPHTLIYALACKKKNIPTLITTYGPLNTHRDYSKNESTLLSIYDRFITPRIFNLIGGILCRNPSIVEWAKRIVKNGSKIHLTPSGFPDFYKFKGNGKRIRQEYTLRKNIVLYVGRLNPQKGVQYLVKAATDIIQHEPETSIVLVGPSEDRFGVFLTKLVKNLHLENNIVFTGPIFDEIIERDLYASCDVFVMPSSFEGWSQAVMKAGCQSKPVVASNVGGIPYQLAGGRGILSPFGDSKALAKSVNQLLSDNALRNKIGIRFQKWAQKYTFSHLAKELLNIYESLLSTKLLYKDDNPHHSEGGRTSINQSSKKIQRE